MFLRAVINLSKFKINVPSQIRYCSNTAAKPSDDQIVEIENPFTKGRRECILCKHKIELDYKNVRLLSQFQSRHTGQLYPRHITGLCKAKYAILRLEITKAQLVGLMGGYTKNLEYVYDPKLFNPDKPLLPHSH